MGGVGSLLEEDVAVEEVEAREADGEPPAVPVDVHTMPAGPRAPLPGPGQPPVPRCAMRVMRVMRLMRVRVTVRMVRMMRSRVR